MPARSSWRKPSPGDQRIGIVRGGDDFRDAGGDDGIGAGRRAAGVRAGFEGDIERGAAGAVAGFFEREDFGVLDAVPGVRSRGRRFRRPARSRRPPSGLGVASAMPSAGQVERFAHVVGDSYGEERIDEVFGIERQQVVDFFADADEADGQASSRAMATTTPPFAVPSSLVRTMPVTPEVSVNLRACSRPFCPVVASSTSSTSCGASGITRDGGAAHLFQLRHQIGFGLQAAGGIDDDVIDFARFGGLERVEHHGAGIGAGVLADHLGVGALAPDFELLDGGGAEGVGGAEQNGVAFGLEMRGQFADGGGFARAVDADHHDDGGRLVDVGERAVVGLQDFEQIFADEAAQLAGIADQFAVDALADAVENFVGGGDADIGADERVFELFEQIGVDFLAAGDDVFDARDEAGAGFLDAAFEFFEKRRLLLDGAEKGLDHLNFYDWAFYDGS